MLRNPGMTGSSSSSTVNNIMMAHTHRSALDDDLIGPTWYQSV